jgi:hypothetical protein
MANIVNNYLLAVGNENDINSLNELFNNIDKSIDILSKNRDKDDKNYIYHGEIVKKPNDKDFDNEYAKTFPWDLVYGQSFFNELKYSSFGFEYLIELYKKLKIKSHNLEKNQVKFQGLLFFFQSKYTDPDFSNLSTKFPNIVFHFYIDGELDLRTSRSCLKYFFKSGVEENYK